MTMEPSVRFASVTLTCLLVGALFGADAPPNLPLSTDWVSAAQRRELQNIDIPFKDHAGRPGVLRNLLNKPVVITFFYTRCQNGKKCSMAVSRLGALQRQLAQAGIGDKVRLIAITYEPQFDTPERINRYAIDRGFSLGENALALQLDPARQPELIDELQAPVSFNAGWVNTHGVELSLLDASGRLVRQYHTLLWDNDQVTEDLKRLVSAE
jgi:protein SCO1